MKKCNVIDKLLSEGWFDSRKEVEAWILAGKVLVDNKLVRSAFEKIPCDAQISIREYYKRKYVNKGGLKLEHALEQFHVKVEGKVALDCGASTGGFTDCLLLNGANKVYAVDTGHGQLSSKLINDLRVENMENTNISDEKLCNLIPKPDIITLDLTYLSIKNALSICKSIIGPNGEVIALVKPIYEVNDTAIRRSGDINDFNCIYNVILDLLDYLKTEKMTLLGFTYSPITGNSGAVEFFLHISYEQISAYDLSENEIKETINHGLAINKFKKTSTGQV